MSQGKLREADASVAAWHLTGCWTPGYSGAASWACRTSSPRRNQGVRTAGGRRVHNRLRKSIVTPRRRRTAHGLLSVVTGRSRLEPRCRPRERLLVFGGVHEFPLRSRQTPIPEGCGTSIFPQPALPCLDVLGHGEIALDELDSFTARTRINQANWRLTGRRGFYAACLGSVSAWLDPCLTITLKAVCRPRRTPDADCGDAVWWGRHIPDCTGSWS